jgi:hypothetical protein
MMEALSSAETSVLTTATRCNIPEDAIRCFLLPYLCVHNEFFLHVYQVLTFVMKGVKATSSSQNLLFLRPV